MLGWLAAQDARSERAAWLLGAADALWRGAGGRLGSLAVMEQRHQLAAKQAREALGGLHYGNAHDRGGALDLATVLAWAIDDRDAVPWPDDAGSPRDNADAFAGFGAGAAGNAADLADGGDGSEPETAAPVTASALTRREREIALLVASGLSNRDIATRLFISKRTVDAHVEHIFAKLEISSRVKLTMWLQSQARIGA